MGEGVMPRKRTGNVLWEVDHFVARVCATNRPDDGKRIRIPLPKEFTKEQAQAAAQYYAANPEEVAKIAAQQKATKRSAAIARSNKKRAKEAKRTIRPKLHGKSGRALRTEKGRVVFHQHVVASLITKTAKDIASGKRRTAIYEQKGCDGTDPIVGVCNAMNVPMVGVPLQYAREACE